MPPPQPPSLNGVSEELEKIALRVWSREWQRLFLARGDFSQATTALFLAAVSQWQRWLVGKDEVWLAGGKQSGRWRAVEICAALCTPDWCRRTIKLLAFQDPILTESPSDPMSLELSDPTSLRFNDPSNSASEVLFYISTKRRIGVNPVLFIKFC